MNLKTLIKQRFSVRNFKNVAVKKEDLCTILEAARFAPSAVNFQPWRFLVIQSKDGLNKIYKIYNREWIKTAPAVIIALANKNESWKRKHDVKDFGDIDVAIALDHLTLQAAEIGLGTCWVCNFDAEQCKHLFKIPQNMEPVAIIPVGYPNTEIPEKKRKNLDEIVFWEKIE